MHAFRLPQLNSVFQNFNLESFQDLEVILSFFSLRFMLDVLCVLGIRDNSLFGSFGTYSKVAPKTCTLTFVPLKLLDVMFVLLYLSLLI